MVRQNQIGIFLQLTAKRRRMTSVKYPVPTTLVEKAKHAEIAAAAYLRGRQCSDGGFCFYRSEYLEEANLADTYHAVAALRLIGADVPHRDRLVVFLEDSVVEAGTSLFFYAFTLDLLGLASTLSVERIRQIERLILRAPHDQSVTGVSTWLEEAARVLSLQRRFARVPEGSRDIDMLAEFRNGGGFGKYANVLDTWFGLSILQALGKLPPPLPTRDFVRDLQVPGFGFVVAPGGRATSLEAIHAGVGCCRVLNAAIEYPVDVLEFVLGCQSRDGAFARQPVALPDIELTHQALEVIEAIVGEHA